MYQSPKAVFEEKIATKLKTEPAKGKAINAKVNFAITGDQGGTWLLDCSADPATIVAGEAPDAAVTVTMTDIDFVMLANGQLKPEMAFLTGKLKVKGNMSLAIKLGQILV